MFSSLQRRPMRTLLPDVITTVKTIPNVIANGQLNVVQKITLVNMGLKQNKYCYQ